MSPKQRGLCKRLVNRITPLLTYEPGVYEALVRITEEEVAR